MSILHCGYFLEYDNKYFDEVLFELNTWSQS